MTTKQTQTKQAEAEPTKIKVETTGDFGLMNPRNGQDFRPGEVVEVHPKDPFVYAMIQQKKLKRTK